MLRELTLITFTTLPEGQDCVMLGKPAHAAISGFVIVPRPVAALSHCWIWVVVGAFDAAADVSVNAGTRVIVASAPRLAASAASPFNRLIAPTKCPFPLVMLFVNAMAAMIQRISPTTPTNYLYQFHD